MRQAISYKRRRVNTASVIIASWLAKLLEGVRHAKFLRVGRRVERSGARERPY